GGMITCSDPSLAKRLRRFRHHGIDVDVVERDAKQRWYYDMVELGYNYRLSDIHCALGLSQLRKVDRFLKRREAIVAQYDKAFQSLTPIQLPPHASPKDRHAWHLYVVRLNLELLGCSRDDAFEQLRAQGIGAHVLYRPIYLHSFYQKQGWKRGDCPVIEKTFERLLCIPIFPAMTEAMVQKVIASVLQLSQVKV